MYVRSSWFAFTNYLPTLLVLFMHRDGRHFIWFIQNVCPTYVSGLLFLCSSSVQYICLLLSSWIVSECLAVFFFITMCSGEFLILYVSSSSPVSWHVPSINMLSLLACFLCLILLSVYYTIYGVSNRKP
jgi:hypothetical protein